jgi:2-iminobutanoate/2-iminopropanoate deaminase
VAEQVELTLRNVEAVLAAAGGSLDDALMVRVYLTRADHFAEMDETYRRILHAPYPARTTVFVGLGAGMLVEIDALAVIPAAG